MSSELIADLWLESVLKGDAALMALVGGRIYSEEAEDLTTPFLVWNVMADNSVQTINNEIVNYDSVYFIKAVDSQPLYTTGAAIMDRVRTLLHKKSGSVSGGGKVLSCVQGERVRYSEVSDGVAYRHYGHKYEIKTQE
jgi:hypothetical protein